MKTAKILISTSIFMLASSAVLAESGKENATETSRAKQQAQLMMNNEKNRQSAARAYLLGAYMVKKSKTVSDVSTQIQASPQKGKAPTVKN